MQKPVELYPSLKRAKAELEAAERAYHAKLRMVQRRCKHKHGTRIARSNSGNYDPSADRYWFELRCPQCEYYEVVDQDKYLSDVRDGIRPKFGS